MYMTGPQEQAHGPFWPVPANRPPVNPEVELPYRLTALVDHSIAFYESQQPHDSRRSPGAQGGTIDIYWYRDGTERRVTQEGDKWHIETKVHAPAAVSDTQGRRALVVRTQYADGLQEYDLRFLPSPSHAGTTYRWSTGQPIAEVRGRERRPLGEHTAEFGAAWASAREVDGRWRALMVGQTQPDGAIRVGRTGASLLGVLVDRAFGPRRRRS